jgi:RNA polymerase sigma factor (sigma-70 family)
MDDAAVEQGDAELTGAADAATDEGDVTLSAEDATELVVATIQAHADSLLRLARRHSLCADDAYDAYQRAMEIFIRRACTLDPARATGWIHVVVKHEALAVRQARLRLVGGAEVDFDAHEAHDVPSPEDRLLRFEHVTRSAEALARLKPQEARALWLMAAGSSYAQIAQETGWSYTNVFGSEKPVVMSSPTQSSSGSFPASVSSVTRSTNRPMNRPSASIDSQAPCKVSRSAALSSRTLSAWRMRPLIASRSSL